MAPHPSFSINFANVPDYLDPRMTFARTSIASYYNRAGQVAYVPAGAPRWTYDTETGECLGIVIESDKTNLALYSEDFTNAIWTKTNSSAVAGATTAPDGTATAEKVYASASSAGVSQVVSVAVDSPIYFSIFAKADDVKHLQMRVANAGNTVDAWFNLDTGEMGTYTSGSGTVVFNHRQMDALANGWYRCGLGVNTQTNTSFTCAFYPTIADNTPSASANAIFVWGAQIEAGGILGISSYIPTTASTVLRDADSLVAQVSTAVDRWFNQSDGTVYFDYTNWSAANANAVVVGGIGDTFDNTVYVVKGSTNVAAAYRRSAVGTTTSYSQTFGLNQRYKIALAWSSTQVAFALNGASTAWASSNTSYVPASTKRMAIGQGPWTATPGGAFGIFKAAAFYPQRLTNLELEELTTIY